jgi:hypothetical protein
MENKYLKKLNALVQDKVVVVSELRQGYQVTDLLNYI